MDSAFGLAAVGLFLAIVFIRLAFPVMILASVLYLIWWLINLIRTIKRGKRSGELKKTLAEKKWRWIGGSVLLVFVSAVLIFNAAMILKYHQLDKTDPYYEVDFESVEVSEVEMLKECPSIQITDEEKQFINAIFSDSEAQEIWGAEEYYPCWLPDDVCARLIEQYPSRPSDICRIGIYDYETASIKIDASIWVEFYETEEDKESGVMGAYPCLQLYLDAEGYGDQQIIDLNSPSLQCDYEKRIYEYSFKTRYERIGSSGPGGPDAAYKQYACEETSTGETSFTISEKILTPMKFHHVYLYYFGWWHRIMSV